MQPYNASSALFNVLILTAIIIDKSNYFGKIFAQH